MGICSIGKRRWIGLFVAWIVSYICFSKVVSMIVDSVRKIKFQIWMKQGEDASIEAAVMAISNCLKEPVGPNNCSEVK